MNKVVLEIYGAHSMLKGDFDLVEVDKVTSYPVQGAEYSKAYQKGLWDGRKHLFNKSTGAFPTGLVSIVRTLCEDLGYDITVDDKRVEPSPQDKSFDLIGVSMEGKYAYQLEACKTAIEAKQGIIKVATGGGKSIISAAIIKYLGCKTLFLVKEANLMHQMVQTFKDKLGITEPEIGIVGDGEWRPGSWITIGMVPTLESRLKDKPCQELLKSIEVLFIDECHDSGSETFYSVTAACPAFWRFGMSGTPLCRTDGANMRLIATTGDIIVDISTKELMELEVIAKTAIVFDSITEPILPKKTTYPQAYKAGVSANAQALQKVVEWTKIFHSQGLSTLILVSEIGHGKAIDDALWTQTDGVFIPHQFIHGGEDTPTRIKALQALKDRTMPVLISSVILDQGIDVPSIDTMIVAGNKKSKIRTLQRLGRGLRGDKLILVEFANMCHKHLTKHSLERLKDYRAEDCFKFYNSSPNEELVKKLWNEELVR